MGVIYKLRPEVKEAIIEEKRKNPHLSCRKLIDVIEKRHNVKVSKSSINALTREAGLSLPIGRRAVKAKIPVLLPKPVDIIVQSPVLPSEPVKIVPILVQPSPIPVQPPRQSSEIINGLGGIFLKAADYLLGGSFLITESIKKKSNKADPQLLAKIEYAIYKQLSPEIWLPLLLNQEISALDRTSYINELQQVTGIDDDLSRIITNVVYPVRVMRFTLIDGSVFYVDGQWHTIWSSPNTPLDFSVTFWGARNYIRNYFMEKSPCLLFMATPEDHPPEVFLNFLAGMQNQEKKLESVTLYGDKLEILETINLEKILEYQFAFGLWPWQFSRDRVVKVTGEFKPFDFKPLKTTFYIADIEVVLTQNPAIKSVTLKGVALKTSLNEKIQLVILSNNKQASIEELASLYLNHWPNLEECLRDFNKKLEYLVYSAESSSLSLDKLGLPADPSRDLSSFFDGYLRVLDLYVKRFFLPALYQNNDFSTINELFYALGATITQEQNTLLIRFSVSSGYKYRADLEYACRRVNERQVLVKDNLRLWLSCG